ncbi:MAG: selenoneine biosynthesis selenosugar synthase SenB [Gammaproteobacteria bacterium]
MPKTNIMPQVVIVSPALRAANNGNWQTARRWRAHLSATLSARIVKQWPDGQADRDSVMVALHARRSADAIAAWSARHPERGLAVVLTGTDLYRDLPTDASTQRSLELAQVLVVLQECAPQSVPDEARAKTRVIFQSTTSRKPLPKSSHRLRAIMVGHLREEKSPETLFAAARLLASHPDIRIDHIGEAMDPSLGEAAQATAAAVPNYRWLGGLPHEGVRRRIQRAHLLIHASRMEGGAHVVMEAVASGTPVLASDIDGNVGMLGADYAGYFPWGDADALAALLLRCRDNLRLPGSDDLLQTLVAQCRQRASLFDLATERSALQCLVHDLLGEH